MSRLVTVTVESVTKCHGHVIYVTRFVTKIVEIWLSQKYSNLMKFPKSLKQHSNSCKATCQRIEEQARKYLATQTRVVIIPSYSTPDTYRNYHCALD